VQVPAVKRSRAEGECACVCVCVSACACVHVRLRVCVCNIVDAVRTDEVVIAEVSEEELLKQHELVQAARVAEAEKQVLANTTPRCCCWLV
jgi:hypothetical protein